MRRGLGALSLFLLLGAGNARADSLPPDQYECEGLGKKAGDTCTTVEGKAGRCELLDGCTTKDMANWDRDASTYPPIITYACPKCVPSADDGACAIATPSPARRIAPWVLAASFSLLFLFGRHRRRR